MNKKIIMNEINDLINECDSIREKHLFVYDDCDEYCILEEIYDVFNIKVLTFLKHIMKDKESDSINEIKSLKYNSAKNLQKIKCLLENVKQYIEKEFIELDEIQNYSCKLEKVKVLETVFKNFHKMVRKIRERYDNRNTLDINDEYDVQDLLFATLQLFFDDIRKEEWTPSYAGNSSRVDFLLKKEKIVIEVKKTRASMKDKDLGEQLIIDIAKYKVHPDCEKLICFVYDPEARIANR